MSELAQLRAAGRQLSPERTIAALERSFESWRAPDSPWRRRLAKELGLYSQQVIDTAVCQGLASWTGAALRQIHRDEARGFLHPPELTAVWLGGAIPTGTFAAIALPLLAGSAVVAKSPSGDPVSAALFAESLAKSDAAVGSAVKVGASRELLAEADAVVAYGSDETMAALRELVPRDHIFVPHGHKVSAAAIGVQADLTEAARLVAFDAALYDGRGCLSPAYVLVEDIRGRAEQFAAALADALAQMATELPRGPSAAAEATALRERRARAALADERVWLSEGSTDWGVFLSPPDARPEPGVLRHLPVVPLRAGLERWCSGLHPHLSSLAVLGFADSHGTAAATAGGGSRVCAPGQLQLPELGWRHDGFGAIDALLRRGDA